MAALPISVIVVSRNRPKWLRRCLLALGQLDYPRLEIRVVACPDGASVARKMGGIAVHEFDRPNISAARNLGVSMARGAVVAFIDDDAVPEPTWLAHLARVFDDPDVAQAGGTTLGRNGISVQQAASRVDVFGRSYPLALDATAPGPVTLSDDRYPRLHGTNMAIRRDCLVDQAGFDERFAFYLDETDLTLRLARAGGATMFVPSAVVHHANGESAFRGADRTPRSVFEIAASAAVFHAKHCPDAVAQEARDMFLLDRRNWLLRHMHSGALGPDTAYRLIRDLRRGYDAGLQRPAVMPREFPDPKDAVPEAPKQTGRDVYLSRPADTAKLRSLIESGHRVSVFDYRLDARFHQVSFTDAGYWRHTGGIFGRELRSEPLVQRGTRARRMRDTLDRLSGIRAISEIRCGD
ncbi:glycosyltransferase [Marivita sp.]|uniref:glycosyltransferase family 2 protein n=1 Tax=Marivita sp. TaxID=2003365 RepID=UPI0025C68709|nr:glycosyltransferase [Marivita sp.]